MFTGRAQKNRGAATSYFDEHLAQNDYYSQDVSLGQQAGQWIGQGSERLGLNQGEVVSREAFLRLCDNLHPSTARRLTLGTGKERRIFFDFQCAPPKSVSILAVTMEDRRMVQAHREASEIALRELEQFASARIRKGGVENRDRTTANLVGASFLHTASRALDPQLHTHFVLFNATFDPAEGQWKALQTSAMFEAIHYGTAVYRNELAKRLQGIGYSLRRTTDAFEVEGVSPELIERFSKRSKQRDEAVGRAEKRLGRKLTHNEVSHLVHQSRPRKSKGVSEHEVRAKQLHEIGFFEKRALRKVVSAANGMPAPEKEVVGEAEALGYALAHVFERQSVNPQHRILEAALVKGCGHLVVGTLKEALQQRPELVRVGTEFSTREILTRELFLIRTVNAGVGVLPPIAERYQAPPHLGSDQQQALTHLITARDRFTGFRGLAGTGKSTALLELARVLQAEGWQSLFCAPTAAAVDVLRKDLKAMRQEPVTVAKLLADVRLQDAVSARCVLILDEAGAVGLEDMVKLFELAKLRDARVVLSGDTGQHASVVRGDALRIIEEYSNYRFAELTTLRRQKPAEYRKAVELAARKETAKAFAILEKLGAVTESPTDGGLYDQAAAAYLSATNEGRSALLISPTWVEIEAVTGKVRDVLRAAHQLRPEEQAVQVLDSFSWTRAQKTDPGFYQSGHHVRFVRSAGGFNKGEMAEVISTGGRTLKLRQSGGSEVAFSPSRHGGCVDVGEVRDLKVSPGDWLLLQSNAVAGRQHFTNGERVQVKGFAGQAISLTDGRVLPADYRTFTHGYAVTSHGSQGRTVDEVLVVASSKSFAAVNQEQFYVSISRARERVHIFTDDAETLRRRVGDSGERRAALELTGLRDALSSLGFRRTPGSQTPGMAKSLPPSRFSVVRALRPTRTTRLSPVQCIVAGAHEN